MITLTETIQFDNRSIFRSATAETKDEAIDGLRAMRESRTLPVKIQRRYRNVRDFLKDSPFPKPTGK